MRKPFTRAFLDAPLRLAGLALLLFVAFSVAAQAQFNTRSDGNGGLIITRYTGSGNGAVVIPGTINGLPVTGIGTYAFMDTHPISVTIPSSVTSIQSYAFYFCSLTSVTIPDNVTNLGDNAFAYSSVANITLGSGITSIADRTFYSCSNLTGVTIPASVTSIGQSAFYGCVGLTNITLGSGVATIGQWAFFFCPALTSLTIPNNVISIGASAFFECINLASVTIGNGVTSIGTAAFDDCGKLTAITVSSSNSAYSSSGDGVLFDKNKLTLVQYPGGKTGSYTVPASVTGIASSAFSYCTNLAGVMLPGGLISIGSSAFSYSSLSSVMIPNNVTTIGDYAFNNSALATVTIGNSVASIGNNAFQGCHLASVTIPNSVTSIGDDAFGACPLTSVIIPNSVTSMGRYVFYGCTSLTTAVIGSGVTSIGSNTFAYCYSLANLSLGNGLADIGPSAFTYCSSLASVQFPNSITHIEDYAFSGCSQLTRAFFIGNAPTMGTSVFGSVASGFKVIYPNDATGFATPTWTDNSGYSYPALPCFNITTDNGQVTITGYNGPGGAITIGTINSLPVTDIAANAFLNNNNLVSVTIGASVTTIGAAAFAGCSSLTAITVDASNPAYSNTSDGVLFDKNQTTLVQYPGAKVGGYTIPNSITSIAQNAFYRCTGLTSVAIPNNVTSIGQYAFLFCSKLTSVTIPSSVTSMGDYAVALCGNLASAVFLGNAPMMGVGVFDYDAGGFTVFYDKGATGFTSPTWTDSSGDTYAAAIVKITFSQWETGYSFSNSATATPQNDGVPNLLKYLYDIDPSVPMSVTDHAALPVFGTTEFQGDPYLTLTYRQNAAENGITVNLQASTDLQTWTTVSSSDPAYLLQNIGTDPTTGDPIVQLGVKTSGDSRMFIRLNVTMP